MKIYFANIPQKVLWDLELSAQISDGYWENAKSVDHWRDWDRAKTYVDPKNPRVEFDVAPKRRNYNFTSKDLLSFVGNRMLAYVRLALVYGYENLESLDRHLLGLNGNVRFPGKMVASGDVRRAEHVLGKLGTTAHHIHAIATNEAIYSEKQLKKDLSFMKKLIGGKL